MSLIDGLSAGLLLLGAGFFLVGTLGVLRFPDLYTRLHALSKVDNLGLGFTVVGLMLQASDLREVLKLLLVWLLALAASATVSFLIARRAYRRGLAPWQVQERRP